MVVAATRFVPSTRLMTWICGEVMPLVILTPSRNQVTVYSSWVLDWSRVNWMSAK
jgi:hypothetical protein